MITYILISILVFWLFIRFTRNIEIKGYREWQEFKLPVWGWSLIVILALIPFVNVISLVTFEIICIADSRSRWPDIRFKEPYWINKIIDLMTKEI